MRKNTIFQTSTLLLFFVVVATFIFNTGFVYAEDACYIVLNFAETIDDQNNISLSYSGLINVYGDYSSNEAQIMGASNNEVYLLYLYDSQNREIGKYTFGPSLLYYSDDYGAGSVSGDVLLLAENSNSVYVPYQTGITSAKIKLNGLGATILDFVPSGAACTVNCVTENGLGVFGEDTCCNGLVTSTPTTVAEKSFYCVNCGDRVCSSNEDWYSCSNDCPQEDFVCAYGMTKIGDGCVKLNSCGNGIVESANNEECDDGSETETCTADCKIVGLDSGWISAKVTAIGVGDKNTNQAYVDAYSKGTIAILDFVANVASTKSCSVGSSVKSQLNDANTYVEILNVDTNNDLNQDSAKGEINESNTVVGTLDANTSYSLNQESVTLRFNFEYRLSCVPFCTAEWNCSDWNECTNNERTRICTQTNACTNQSNIPLTKSSCGSCFDSDNSREYFDGMSTLLSGEYTLGETTGPKECVGSLCLNFGTEKDSCIGGARPNVLNEAYCSDANTIAFKEIYCPETCANGLCGSCSQFVTQETCQTNECTWATQQACTKVDCAQFTDPVMECDNDYCSWTGTQCVNCALTNTCSSELVDCTNVDLSDCSMGRYSYCEVKDTSYCAKS